MSPEEEVDPKVATSELRRGRGGGEGGGRDLRDGGLGGEEEEDALVLL